MESGLTRRELLVTAGGAVAAGTLAGEATAQSAANWLSLGNDPGNTGRADGSGPIGDVGSAWTAETGGSVVGGPAVVGDLVVVGSEDGVLYGFDATSGGTRWEFEAPEGEIDTTPAIAGNTAYVGDTAGFLYAVDTESGEERSSLRFETEGAVTAPAVFDGTVYISSGGGSVHAIDADEQQFDPEGWPVDIGPGLESAPAVATGEDSGRGTPTVYVGSDNGSVSAIDAESGSTVWSTSLTEATRVPTSPAVADGTVYVGSQGDGPLQGRLHAVNGATGEEEWSFDTSSPVFASPAVAGGSVYAGTRSGQLFAVDTSGGTEQWVYDAGQQIPSAPAVTDDAVYAASLINGIVGVDRASGEELWTFETNQQVLSNPAVADDAVFVGSDGNVLYRLEAGAEGGAAEQTPENTGPVPDPLERDDPNEFTFLVPSLLAGSLLALVAGGAYAAKRAGVLERFSIEEAQIEEIYDDDEHIPDYDEPPATDVWDYVVADVIDRADETDKIATENLIISRYLDRDTLESPVVAYEIESARDDAAGVHIEEQLVDAEDTAEEMADQPLNEGWSVAEEQLVYERAIDAGETVKTMVGRVDCPTDRADELADSPDVAIDTDGSDD